jgi:Leucine-rich repeat (LRR) protein
MPKWLKVLAGSLVDLQMNDNPFTGSIDIVKTLKKLKTLSLCNWKQLSYFNGTIDAVEGLVDLETLALNGLPFAKGAGLAVHFSGPIDALQGLKKLKYLWMANNYFSGTLGPVAGLTQLTSLNTHSNLLKGTVDMVKGLASLELLWLQSNRLTGGIDALNQLTNLQGQPAKYGFWSGLDLSNNQFTGPIDAVYNMRQLRGLNLANNSFTGIIGDGFRAQTMPNLTFIDLSVNNFTAVPSNIVDWSRFTDHCDLHHEAFTCSTAMAIPAQAKAHCGATCCVGSSADLVGGDCDAWQKFTRDPVYTKWAEGKCGAKVHTDPCSCSAAGNGGAWHVECADGRIDYIKMDNSGLPRGVVPMALLDLTGLKTLQLGGNGLSSTIPSAIGQLQQLESLILWQNDLHGAIPHELTTLSHLNTILFNSKHLTGVLPAFNFSQLATCVMAGPIFTCPLPPGAETCVGNAEIPSVGKWPPPHCQ